MNEVLRSMSPNSLKYAGIGLLLVFIALLLSSGVTVVDTGQRGIEVRFGKVVGESMAEGLYFYNPITTRIVKLDVRERKTEEKSLGYTKDVQNVELTVATNFQPDPTMVHVLYEKVGPDFAQKLVPQVVQAKIKEIAGQYEAVKLISERQAASQQIFDSISTELKAKGIVIRNFEITNINFNDPFERAVEAKVVAVQQAEEAKNKTVKVKEEADQKIISAKAEAESMRIRAQALSQNKGLVEYEAVQKWNGKLPDIMAGGGSVPFINVNTSKQ